MRQYIIKFPSEIIEYERQGRWDMAVEFAYEYWQAAPMELERLLYAGIELWYSILEEDYYCSAPRQSEVRKTLAKFLPVLELENKLAEVTRWGIEHFEDSPAFNLYFGYMMQVMPYFFLDYGGDYHGWREKGLAMQRRAYEMDPTNSLAKAMFYESYNCEKDALYREACTELWKEITPEEWGDSEFQAYLFYILKGHFTHGDPYEKD